MVASISARGGVESALGYYEHLGQDDYYMRDDEPPGGWAGKGADRLSLSGPVTRTEFEAALRGMDPKTGERLAALTAPALSGVSFERAGMREWASLGAEPENWMWSMATDISLIISRPPSPPAS